MVKRISAIIKRNLQIYSNSKLSSLIIILGPLILILMVSSLLQDTSLKNINAGVFSQEEGTFKDNFINRLNERSFIIKQEGSLESCKKDVINEITHVCIHLKKGGFVVPGYKNYDIDIYVDFSKQNIVWGIIGSIQGIIEQESSSTREAVIKDIKNDVESLNSKLIAIENTLNVALSITTSFREKSSSITTEINDLKLILSSTKSVLQGINSIQYSLEISNLINQLDSSEQKLESLEQNIPSESEIRNLENELKEIKSSVTDLKQEINGIKEINVNRLADPIVLSYYSVSEDGESGVSKGKLEILDYLFPSFLIFFLLFGSLLFTITTIIRERKSNAYIRNITSINNRFIFLFGNFLTIVFLVFFQTLIIISVASLFLNVDIFANIFSLLGVTLISIIIFTLMGIALGYLFNSYESATIASISVALLLLIFSSAIIPIETLPKIFYEIIKVSPLTLLESKMRVILMFGSILKMKLIEIISLSSVFIISIIAILLFYNKNEEKEI
ncbi:MAG: ABC transporter permease [Nanoarchaeota archaeon]